MSTTSVRRVLMALIFSIIMTGFFWISANTNPAFADVSVTVQAEDQYGNIILQPTQVDVPEGYAAMVSGSTFYNDSPASDYDATALDALFAAHDLKYPNVFSSNG